MYRQKIIASLDNLAEGELKALWEKVQMMFVLDTRRIGEGIMLRDDIRDEVFDMIKADFVEPKFIVQEQYNWIELNMDANDINTLTTLIEKEFDIPFISPDAVSKWNTVADMVNYIEDTLECALYGMGEKDE